jgi:hypothetical protein
MPNMPAASVVSHVVTMMVIMMLVLFESAVTEKLGLAAVASDHGDHASSQCGEPKSDDSGDHELVSFCVCRTDLVHGCIGIATHYGCQMFF